MTPEPLTMSWRRSDSTVRLTRSWPRSSAQTGGATSPYEYSRDRISGGGITAATITAQKFVAPLLDRYLASTGYTSQQTDKPVDPDRLSNLWQPVDRPSEADFGSHGVFDSQAHSKSIQMWVSQHVRIAGAAAVSVGSLAATARLFRRSPASGSTTITRRSAKR